MGAKEKNIILFVNRVPEHSINSISKYGKINGKKAYALARRGQEFTQPKRLVNIKKFTYLGIDLTNSRVLQKSKEDQLPKSTAYFF